MGLCVSLFGRAFCYLVLLLSASWWCAASAATMSYNKTLFTVAPVDSNLLRRTFGRRGFGGGGFYRPPVFRPPPPTFRPPIVRQPVYSPPSSPTAKQPVIVKPVIPVMRPGTPATIQSVKPIIPRLATSAPQGMRSMGFHGGVPSFGSSLRLQKAAWRRVPSAATARSAYMRTGSVTLASTTGVSLIIRPKSGLSTKSEPVASKRFSQGGTSPTRAKVFAGSNKPLADSGNRTQAPRTLPYQILAMSQLGLVGIKSGRNSGLDGVVGRSAKDALLRRSEVTFALAATKARVAALAPDPEQGQRAKTKVFRQIIRMAENHYMHKDSLFDAQFLRSANGARLTRTLEAYHSGAHGASVRNFQLIGKSWPQIRDEALQKGFAIKQLHKDGASQRHIALLHRDGGMIRVKPDQSDSGKILRPEPHASKSVRHFGTAEDDTSHDAEAFKISASGKAVPKSPYGTEVNQKIKSFRGVEADDANFGVAELGHINIRP